MLIDTHVHLNIDEFKDRLDEVVKMPKITMFYPWLLLGLAVKLMKWQ